MPQRYNVNSNDKEKQILKGSKILLLGNIIHLSGNDPE